MWEFRGNRLYISPPMAEDQDDPDILINFCERFEVVAKYVDLLTGVEELEIVIRTAYAEKPLRLPREKMTQPKILSELTQQGLTVLDGDNAKNVVLSVLFETEAIAPVIFTHTRLGFTEIQGAPCFLGHHPIGQFTTEQLRSTYIDTHLTAPSGSPKRWRRFLCDEIVSHPELCLVLTLSASAPVAHLLKVSHLFNDVPLWALIGDSSTGKSTMLALSGSLWFNPARMVQNFNATDNAFFSMLQEQNGIPFLVDEGTYTPSFDWDALLYSLPAGKAKRRCDRSGRLKPAVEFSGAVIVTSELSILERSHQNPGQYARIVEFSLNWTENNAQAEKITSFCSRNYGWAAEPIIRLLLSDGFVKKLGKRYLKTYRRLCNSAKWLQDGIDYRLLQRLALLLVSGWVFEKAVKVSLHLDTLEHLLTQIFTASSSAHAREDAADSLHHLLAEQVLQHQSKFPEESMLMKKNRLYVGNDLWGMRGYHGLIRCVWITDTRFQRMVRKQVAFGIRSACQKLESKNYIVRFYGDRFVKEIMLGSLPAKCYCVLFPDAENAVQQAMPSGAGKTDLVSMAKSLNHDPLGLLDDYAQEKALSERHDPEKPAIAFLSLGANHVRLVINQPLRQELQLDSDLHLHVAPLPAKGLLLMSKAPLAKNLKPFVLHTGKSQFWTDVSKVQGLLKTMNFDLPLYKRAVFWDISIERKDTPIAVLNMKNTYDSWVGGLCSGNPVVVDEFIDHTSDTPSFEMASENRQILLSDAADDL